MGWFSRKKSGSGSILVKDRPKPGALRAIFGRTYLDDSPYMLPKDMSEANRLDFQHYMLRYALKGNYATPLMSPRTILDVGTGTGRWATEMAALFPQANVFGVDLVPPPVDANAAPDSRPDNYVFVPGNVLDRLPFDDQSFDFVHQRLLIYAIPAHRWPDALSELYRVTAPGGWIELLEGGYLRNMGPLTTRSMEWMAEIGRRRGIDQSSSSKLDQLLSDIGMRQVKSHRIDVPMGQWGGRIGQLMATDANAGNRSMRSIALDQLQISPEEYDRVAKALPEEWEQYHTVVPFYIAYGQKP